MSDLASYEAKIQSAASAADLDALELEIFSRKHGALTLAMKDLTALPPAEKVKKGQELNRSKQTLTDALATRRNELSQKSLGALSSEDKLDVTLELPPKPRGHLHLIPEFIRQVEEVFGRMGFEVAEGPELESEKYNFNDLNIPDTHPARDSQDTFWISDIKEKLPPDKKFVMRTHTSNMQIRFASTHKPPFRIICPGRVYRKDSDATHSPMFHQFEGMMVGKDVSLANLKGVLVTAMRELIGRDVEFRFRTGFFPFVEPGLEMDMMWQGDESESREGKWLEMGGCGMVHPNVLKNCGIDPDEWQGFAFGFGVERPLMIKHQIPDLRSFYHGDLRFLRQF
ncbi:MAG: phenylalanine--tRNA ligase subunit alpha [Candidatus Peribacteraceae bacterium]|nr:phenylalanine--tRNA ligase subunit alpha [Candidatus Peribacteraceae bacterium]